MKRVIFLIGEEAKILCAHLFIGKWRKIFTNNEEVEVLRSLINLKRFCSFAEATFVFLKETKFSFSFIIEIMEALNSNPQETIIVIDDKGFKENFSFAPMDNNRNFYFLGKTRGPNWLLRLERGVDPVPVLFQDQKGGF